MHQYSRRMEQVRCLAGQRLQCTRILVPLQQCQDCAERGMRSMETYSSGNPALATFVGNRSNQRADATHISRRMDHESTVNVRCSADIVAGEQRPRARSMSTIARTGAHHARGKRSCLAMQRQRRHAVQLIPQARQRTCISCRSVCEAVLDALCTDHDAAAEMINASMELHDEAGLCLGAVMWRELLHASSGCMPAHLVESIAAPLRLLHQLIARMGGVEFSCTRFNSTRCMGQPLHVCVCWRHDGVSDAANMDLMKRLETTFGDVLANKRTLEACGGGRTQAAEHWNRRRGLERESS